jgi:multidrug resistance protein, MATE family
LHGPMSRPADASAPAALTWRDELRATLRLAVPVVAVEIGIMLMGTVDTMFAGRVSGVALASVAIGHAFLWVIAVFGIGILMVLDPLVSQAHGAGDELALARGVQRAMVLAVPLAVLSGVLLTLGEPVLRALRQPPEVIPIAAAFARASIPGMLPLYAFIVLRQTLQARHRVAPIVVAIVLANLVNLALNYALVFGKFGAPALGPVGTAWANSVARWVMFLALLALTWRELRPYLLPVRADAFAPRPLLRMLGIGVPIAVQYELEINAFAVVAVMMGWIGATQMAAHQVSISLAALTFMVPLGVSTAAAVNVGRAVGRGDAAEMRRAAGAALAVGVGFMALSGLAMLAAPRLLARVYTADPAVLAVAAVLIPLAGLFQVFDGMQVVAVGILRGTGDTRTPMVINVLGFWLLGVPVSWYLGVHLARGPVGLWSGFVVGLAAVAVFLLIRVRMRLRKTIARVVVDEDAPPGAPAVVRE